MIRDRGDHRAGQLRGIEPLLDDGDDEPRCRAGAKRQVAEITGPRLDLRRRTIRRPEGVSPAKWPKRLGDPAKCRTTGHIVELVIKGWHDPCSSCKSCAMCAPCAYARVARCVPVLG